MFTRRDWLKAAAASPVALSFPSSLIAAPPAADLKAVVDKAVKFLTTAQKDAGNFSADPRGGEPGLTALIAAALVRNGVAGRQPGRRQGAQVPRNEDPEGRRRLRPGAVELHDVLAIVAFKEANAGGKYDKVIDAAVKYVRSLQFAEGLTETGPEVRRRGLRQAESQGPARTCRTRSSWSRRCWPAGVSKDDPAIKKALVFISRSQNLKSEFNNQPFAGKTTDEDQGGFVYNLLDQDNEKSEKRTAEGGLRSEGGMTYAGLKSFLYAGVAKDDPRVKAAVAWIRKHYTVTENPGQGQAGLFYYYHTFAKAMDALGEDPFVDAKGVKHDWRQELFDELKKRQKDERELGQHQRRVPRKHARTRHRLRGAGPELLQEEVVRHRQHVSHRNWRTGDVSRRFGPDSVRLIALCRPDTL